MREFNITFKDPGFVDWDFILHTSEEKDAGEIEDIVMAYVDIVSNGSLSDCYTPVDIMDRLCNDMQDDGRDWYWTDDNDEVMIDIW